jgi:transglutaminase-like putative cysteine protease
MLLAPQPHLSAVHVAYGTGLRGIRQTLGIMRAYVKAGRIDPAIRQAATTIVFLQPPKDEPSEVRALLQYMQQSVRYVKDVLNVETLSTAEKTLAGRIGDCDDQSVLLAALCESIGYPTRFVVAGYATPGILEHVYLQVCVDGEWIDADPTESHPLGWAPEDPVTVYYEQV